MKLEDQVVSLELAKKLKEIGVKQESYFSWQSLTNEKWHIGHTHANHLYEKKGRNEFYSAFTACELGEMLPSSIESYGLEIYSTSSLLNGGKFGGNNLWHIRYADKVNELFERKCGIKECDARAEMFIYLIENKLIEVNNAR